MTVYYIVQLTVVLATIESIQFLAKVQLGGKMITVKDKVIIITGAGQGIGRAFANTLAEDGAKVVVAEINGVASACVIDCQIDRYYP